MKKDLLIPLTVAISLIFGVLMAYGKIISYVDGRTIESENRIEIRLNRIEMKIDRIQERIK